MANNSKVKITNENPPESVLWDHTTGRLADSLEGGDFVSSESVLLLATPEPFYSEEALQQAVAVALAQDIQFQQQRQAQQVFEIGSRRKYTFSSGRIQGQLGLSRVMFDGPSLLKSLVPVNLEAGDAGTWSMSPDRTVIGDHAGYGEFFINLGATLFSQPIGLFLVIRDVGAQNVGAVFLQEAYIVSHAMNVSANQPFIGENVSIIYEGAYPVQHRDGAELSPSKIRQ